MKEAEVSQGDVPMSDVVRYAVVTPARNEEAHIGHTIESMIAQTWRPLAWVIVDDGSSDRTGEIIDAAARAHRWIVALHRPDRGARRQGGGVIETFNDGFIAVRDLPWDFLVKFDADLSFESEYFETCLRKFLAEPKLGIGGGNICWMNDGHLVSERPKDVPFHVRGATKIYRRACWEAIGGLVQAAGWDTIDELKANMLGWVTRTFKDVPIRHHRFTGSVDGVWKNQVKFGLSNYITGYHPVFMLAKCFKRLFEHPYIIGAAGLAWGFFLGYLGRHPRLAEAELIRYVRHQQVNKLLGRPSLW